MRNNILGHSCIRRYLHTQLADCGANGMRLYSIKKCLPVAVVENLSDEMDVQIPRPTRC